MVKRPPAADVLVVALALVALTQPGGRLYQAAVAFLAVVLVWAIYRERGRR